MICRLRFRLSVIWRDGSCSIGSEQCLEAEDPVVGEGGDDIEQEPSLQVIDDDAFPFDIQVPGLIKPRVKRYH